MNFLLKKDDMKGHIPLHAQARTALRRMIDEQFEDGQQFLTEAALTKHLGVSLITVRRAVADLAHDGLLDRRGARGTFVVKGQRADVTEFPIGVILPEYESPVTISLLNQIARSCVERNHRLSVYYAGKGENAAAVLERTNGCSKYEKLILLGNAAATALELSRMLWERGRQVVNIGSRIDDYPGAYIGADDPEGIRLGLEHLVGIGHTRITLLVNEPVEQGTVASRIHAFDDLTRRQGLNGGRIVYCSTAIWDDAYSAAYSKMKSIWNGESRPTAIMTVSDAGAFGALKWLTEQGIGVPDDISIVGFGDDRTGLHTSPALTSIGQPYREIAVRAVDLLEAQTIVKRCDLFKPCLIIRNSTKAIG